MKRPIATLRDLQKYKRAIKRVVKRYDGGNIRVLDIDSQGDLTHREEIRLLIDFPPLTISRASVIDLENELFNLLDRFVKVIDPAEEPEDERKKMQNEAVLL